MLFSYFKFRVNLVLVLHQFATVAFSITACISAYVVLVCTLTTAAFAFLFSPFPCPGFGGWISLCCSSAYFGSVPLNWQADSTAKMIPSGCGACRQRLLLLSHTSPPSVSWSVLHSFTLRIISFLFSRYVQNVNYFHYCLKSSIERPLVSSNNQKTLNSLLFGVQVKENKQTIKQKEQKQHQQQKPTRDNFPEVLHIKNGLWDLGGHVALKLSHFL